jgi:hypothetical protein
MTPLIFILTLVVLIFGGPRAGSFLLLTLVGILASIAGIVGAVVSRHRIVSGGLTMLLAGAVPLFLALQVLSFLSLGRVVLLILFLYFWAILLSIGGLICLVRPSPQRF